MSAPSPVRATRSRATRLLLFAILLLSFAVRVVYVLQSRSSPAFTQPTMDALYHLEWARAVAAGRDFQPGPFFRAPLYPWFLGLILRLFGENLLLVRLVQAAIGTASVGLVYLVGVRAFDTRTGLLGALFAGIYWVTIYFEGDFLLPVLEIFFDLLAIWLTLRVDEKPTPLRAALAGAAFGVAESRTRERRASGSSCAHEAVHTTRRGERNHRSYGPSALRSHSSSPWPRRSRP